MDGSCNGLQHYAALARDLTGGFAVNLCPSDKPQARRGAAPGGGEGRAGAGAPEPRAARPRGTVAACIGV